MRYIKKNGNIELPNNAPLLSTLTNSTTTPNASLLQNYANLVDRLEERKYLHSLDTGAENKLGYAELTKRSAARSGFQMPKTYSEEEETK